MSTFDHSRYRPFPAINKANRRWPGQTIRQAPQWCAVDLRDGNQALIEPMTVAQKQRLWQLLVELGFKEIEIGFPSASQPDYDFCRWLLEGDNIPDDVTIQVLVQARDELIKRTYEALQGARRAIVHVYNSTSPTQRQKVFNTDRAGIIEIARRGAANVQAQAARYPQTQWRFQYSPESFSLTETDFAIDVCNAVIDVWQPTAEQPVIINLPATVECAGPNVFADQVETFCEGVNRREAIIVSVHTHNDRGCAVAAAELAVLAGADRVEGTLMGNGERTGNMDIVTMAMNLYSQGINPKLNLADADTITRTVAECTRIDTHPRHPWFGELVYTAFSGSHQDAIKKCLAVQRENDFWDVAYLPINPQDLGRNYQSVVRVNSQSGKGGVSFILEQEFGLALPRWLQIEAAQKVQAYAESEAVEVSPKQILAIVQQAFMPGDGGYQLSAYHISRDNNREVLHATLRHNGKPLELHGKGDGTLAAFCEALNNGFGLALEIQRYDQHSKTSGSNAVALAFMQVQIGRERFTAIAENTDVLAAGFEAILQCLNQACANGLALTA